MDYLTIIYLSKNLKHNNNLLAAKNKLYTYNI